jgi:hypothetical protein
VFRSRPMFSFARDLQFRPVFRVLVSSLQVSSFQFRLTFRVPFRALFRLQFRTKYRSKPAVSSPVSSPVSFFSFESADQLRNSNKLPIFQQTQTFQFQNGSNTQIKTCSSNLQPVLHQKSRIRQKRNQIQRNKNEPV